MPERFAIYYAPGESSALWQRASLWLGRDATRAEPVAASGASQMPPELLAITQSARRYGFHATLKAPMALATGKTRAALEQALQRFALNHGPVPLGKLSVKPIEGFLALVPAAQSSALLSLAGACVAAFEPYRAPISSTERIRRIAAGLTAYQIGLLDHYGYPYVMDQFRFHMTITDRLSAADAERIGKVAEAWFAPVLGDDVVLDRLALFHEPAPGAPFLRIADFPLSSKVKL